MESSFTDTQQKVNRRFICRHINFWAKVDCIDCELSGYSMKYGKPAELLDALGADDALIKKMTHYLRKNLNRTNRDTI
jgi:hypothetical protein